MNRRSFIKLLSGIGVLFTLPLKAETPVDYVVTEKTRTRVYAIMRKYKDGEILQSKDFISVCDLPNPESGTLILSSYKGEKISQIKNNKVTFCLESDALVC